MHGPTNPKFNRTVYIDHI